MLLVTLGIGMSVPIVVWGSGVLARLMNRYPWIIWTGGGLLGYVAGDMILEDPVVLGWLGPTAHALEYPVPAALATGLAGVGWWLARRRP
jgi:predicted tellurium resistance membrane protein TerC